MPPQNIEGLEGRVSILQNSVKLLKKDQHSQEEYARTQCLRIFGLSYRQKEKSEGSVTNEKQIIEDVGLALPDTNVDSARRIKRGTAGKPLVIAVKNTIFGISPKPKEDKRKIFKSRKVFPKLEPGKRESTAA